MVLSWRVYKEFSFAWFFALEAKNSWNKLTCVHIYSTCRDRWGHSIVLVFCSCIVQDNMWISAPRPTITLSNPMDKHQKYFFSIPSLPFIVRAKNTLVLFCLIKSSPILNKTRPAYCFEAGSNCLNLDPHEAWGCRLYLFKPPLDV